MDFALIENDETGFGGQTWGASKSEVLVAPIVYLEGGPGDLPGTISSVTVVDANTLNVAFSLSSVSALGIDTSTVNLPQHWLLTSPGQALQVHSILVTATDAGGNATSVKLGVFPGLSPGAEYVLRAKTAKHPVTSSGVLISPNYATFTTLDSLKPVSAETFPLGILRALTLALGESVQLIKGRPTTRLMKSIGTADTVAVVESTLAFPAKGYVYISGRRVAYRGKTDGSLTGLSFSPPLSAAVPEWQEVALDVRSIFPD